MIGTRIAALESFMRGQGELAARRLEQRMTEWISRDGDWRGALVRSHTPVVAAACGGLGRRSYLKARSLTTGDVPGTEEIRDIARWVSPKLKPGTVRNGESRRTRNRDSRPWPEVASGSCCRSDFGPGRRNVNLVSKRTRSDRNLRVEIRINRRLLTTTRRSFRHADRSRNGIKSSKGLPTLGPSPTLALRGLSAQV